MQLGNTAPRQMDDLRDHTNSEKSHSSEMTKKTGVTFNGLSQEETSAVVHPNSS